MCQLLRLLLSAMLLPFTDNFATWVLIVAFKYLLNHRIKNCHQYVLPHIFRVHIQSCPYIMYIRMYVHMNLPSDSESLSLDSFLCFRFTLEKVRENNSTSIANYTRALITTIQSFIQQQCTLYVTGFTKTIPISTRNEIQFIADY